MAQVTLKGNPVNTSGNLPEIGSPAPEFTMVHSDLSEKKLSDYKGKKVILNIFPSVDTSTCAASVRQFNKQMESDSAVVVLSVSKDLPFAHGRFCEAEGIKNVHNVSVFREPGFGSAYGVEIIDGPLKGLMARSIVVIDNEGAVLHTQLVPEIVDEPDYSAALDKV